MSNILILDEYRKDITFALKQRASLLDVLCNDSRDATAAEEKHLDDLEHAIACGVPRNAREANAQAALASEIWEVLNAGGALPCGFFTAMDRASAAAASARWFFRAAA